MNGRDGLDTEAARGLEHMRFTVRTRPDGRYRARPLRFFMGDTRDELERDLRHEFPEYDPIYDGIGLQSVGAQIFKFDDTPRNGLPVSLDIRGTPFQLSVWKVLQSIPFGEVATYSEIARQVNAPGEDVAVSQACLANKIAVAIPCHRAVGDDGFGEYRWGLKRKRALLRAEALLLTTGFRPNFSVRCAKNLPR